MEVIDELCDLLQVHANRDKVVYLTCYVLKLWGSSRQSAPLLTASARLAGARAVMRLFDDAATLKLLYNYGLGKHEGLWGIVGVANNLSVFAYQQLEKANFVIDTGILPVAKETATRVKTWYYIAFNLVFLTGLIKSLRALHLAAEKLNKPDKPKCAESRFTQASLATTKGILDVIHAVSWLPGGWLWGGKMAPQHASAVASTAAVLGLVIHYRAKRL